MNRARILATMAFLGGAASLSAQSTTNATQNVTVAVTAINQISVTGTATLTINTAVAGQAPTRAVDNSTTYSITTNQTAKITGSLSADVAPGLTLKVRLEAPTGTGGGTSSDYQTLSTEAVELVAGITKRNASTIAISFTLDATAAAGTVFSTTHVLTYTVTGAT